MASPFRVFRKHQKVLLAVVGLMAMISFVFLPIVLERISATRSTVQNVLTTARYGPLSQPEMVQLRQDRGTLLRFLGQVEMALGEQARGLQRQGFEILQVRSGAEVFREQLDPNSRNRRRGGSDEPVGEETVANTWLLANRARELGIVITDNSVNDFLKTIIRGMAVVRRADDSKPSADGKSKPEPKTAKPELREFQLTEAQVLVILRELRVGHLQFLDICRNEMLAQRVRELFGQSLSAIPPGQRWDYFLRLNRKAVAEVLTVSVDQVLRQHPDRVPDPDEATLKAFFEKYKDQLPSPDSPTPGFREPHRLSVEYLKAEQSKFADPASVTDEQIKQYYDQFKDVFYREEPQGPAAATPSGAAAEPAKPAASAAKPAEKPSATTPPKPMEAKPAEAKPAAGAKPEPPSPAKPHADGAKPDAKKSVDAKKSESAKKPGNAKTPAPADKDAPDAKKSGATAPAGPIIRFAAYQAKDEAKPGSEGPALLPASDAAKPPAKPEPAGKPKPQEPEAKPEAKPAEPVKYQPLEKVKDRIRDILAQRQAGAKMQEALTTVQVTLEEYYREWLDYQAVEKTRKEGEPATPPAQPDLEQIAAQRKLTYRATGRISPLDVGRFDIATSTVPNPMGGGAGTPFTTYVFETASQFRPEICYDLTGNAFLFWKTEDVPQRVPSFDDAGEYQKVLARWKEEQGRTVALEEANRLAEEAQKAKKPLTELFGTRPGYVVTKTEPFSWLTFGSMPASLAGPESNVQFSDVRGVDQPGVEFMKKVFDLQPGGVTVASNRPENAFYVIRLVDFTPPPDQLWKSFRDGSDATAIYRVAEIDNRAAMIAWLSGLKTEVGLKWNRDPARGRSAED